MLVETETRTISWSKSCFLGLRSLRYNFLCDGGNGQLDHDEVGSPSRASTLSIILEASHVYLSGRLLLFMFPG